jgi:hypothetical protein
VRVGGALADSETGVEKEDALVGPAGEAAVTRVPPARHVTAQLLVHVHQGGGRRHTLLHGEAETVGLALPMVRVLPCRKEESHQITEYPDPRSKRFRIPDPSRHQRI